MIASLEAGAITELAIDREYDQAAGPGRGSSAAPAELFHGNFVLGSTFLLINEKPGPRFLKNGLNPKVKTRATDR